MECLKLKDLLNPRIGKCDFSPENDENINAQKENLFVEPKRSSPKTPVKNELTASAISRRKCCTPDRIQMTPIKQADRSPPEPWSPTANLKMLISAASPDIRDREKKKELFRQIENERVERISDVIQFGVIDDGTTDEFEERRPSRKQKSLGLLCQKFLARYPNYPILTEKTEISLDEVATELGVERRRIYDIVNVLESLQLVSRVAKNQYSWHGLLGLGQTLAALKRRGEQHRYAEQLAYIRHKELEVEFDGEEAEKREAARETWTGCQELSGEAECKSASMNSRKDKSLRIMSEKFVMLFLVSDPKTVALDIAAKILIEESQQDSADNSKFKTKIRRLYDIANVLTSLGLIKKVHVTEERGRKPAFKWVGPAHQNRPDDIPDHSVPLSASTSSAEAVSPVPANTKERLVCRAPVRARRGAQARPFKAQSAPCSPAKVRKVRSTEAEDCSSKMAQLAAACRLQFEEDIKSSGSRLEDEALRPKSTPLVSRPLLITSTVGSVDSRVKPLTQHDFTAAQSEVTLPVCHPSGQLTPVTSLAAPGTDKGYSCFLKNQPIVFLQTSTPVLMLYGNGDPRTETSSGSSEVQPSVREQALPLGPEEAKAGALNGNTCKRSSPTEQCTVSHGPWEDGKPEAKRGKILCCLEHGSGGSLLSELSLPSVDKRTSAQHTDCLGNHSKSFNHVPGTTACHLSPPLNVEAVINSPSTGTQTEDCHTELRNAEEQNHFVTVENRPPLMASGNRFLIHGQGRLAENSQCYCLPAAPGMNELSLLLSANQSLSGITISPSQMTSVSLPYQMVVPVLCQTVPTATSAGSTIQNAGLMHFNLQNLGLLPTTQLLMGGVSMPTPSSTTTMRSPSPERQIYSPLHSSPALAQYSRENVPVKLDPPALQPVTILKLQQQSPVPLTPRDGQQTFVETYFHTPVSTAQGKKTEGLQIKTASPAQRRLEIENSVTK
ncbi:transcription factor E2F7 [Heptranchias perlo]|uniref:transcription factor E2F7 n=1 Tax=Heptranchias perlo TaxID=212740 RepID=UPI00355A22F5